MKTNKKLLLLTSMVILFPMLWGLMIWSQLPNQIPIHFNFAGQANNFQSKPLVVFGLPIFDLMVHLFMIFMIGRDSKNSAMNAKNDQSDLLVDPNRFLKYLLSHL